MKIFFDVDGVLIDGWQAKPERRRPWSTTLQADLGIDPQSFHHGFFATPIDGHASRMHACICGVWDLKEALGAFLPMIGYAGTTETVMRYWFENDAKRNQPLFDVVRRLRSTPGVTLYLATGQEHHRAAYLWNDLKFKDHFREMFYGARLGYLKSDPAFFQAINSALDIGPEERPVFFDDQPEVVGVARAAG